MSNKGRHATKHLASISKRAHSRIVPAETYRCALTGFTWLRTVERSNSKQSL